MRLTISPQNPKNIAVPINTFSFFDIAMIYPPWRNYILSGIISKDENPYEYDLMRRYLTSTYVWLTLYLEINIIYRGLRFTGEA